MTTNTETAILSTHYPNPLFVNFHTLKGFSRHIDMLYNMET